MPLTPAQVKDISTKINEVDLMQNNAIKTKLTDAAIVSHQKEIQAFFLHPEVQDELLGSWSACRSEYAPLINALTPVVNRVIQAIQQRQVEQAQLQAQAKAAPVIVDN